jgi:hypothetical protein
MDRRIARAVWAWTALVAGCSTTNVTNIYEVDGGSDAHVGPADAGPADAALGLDTTPTGAHDAADETDASVVHEAGGPSEAGCAASLATLLACADNPPPDAGAGTWSGACGCCVTAAWEECTGLAFVCPDTCLAGSGPPPTEASGCTDAVVQYGYDGGHAAFGFCCPAGNPGGAAPNCGEADAFAPEPPPCGAYQQPCCPGNVCTQAQTTCGFAGGVTGCVYCGDLGEACCGSACEEGVCSAGSGGTCVQ